VLTDLLRTTSRDLGETREQLALRLELNPDPVVLSESDLEEV
jgi:hypothetical protein